jgi:hypothetical protein
VVLLNLLLNGYDVIVSQITVIFENLILDMEALYYVALCWDFYVFAFIDIVTEKANFDVSTFIPVLRERMYSKDRYLFIVMPSLLFNI